MSAFLTLVHDDSIVVLNIKEALVGLKKASARSHLCLALDLINDGGLNC